ncbi:MAG: aminotransferase class I/II-fold pyridoxal phosphate-dependent enzyme [Gaiellaceae bacterium]|jgi:acetylornithine aminotransferase
MRFSPVLDEFGVYPFVRLDDARREAAARGAQVIDFGMGDPNEKTEAFIRNAVAANLPGRCKYPRAIGLLELRRAISEWCEKRFGVAVDSEHELIPTFGSKEAIFTFAQIVDLRAPKNLVLVADPAYPVPERGARFAGAEVVRLPLLERNGFLPDLAEVIEETWKRAALVWVNYPNNPTGATAPLSFYEQLAALAVEHDFLLCSDEAYSEIYFDERPFSALQVPDRRNVVVFNTLSKRSSMTGYRSGFVAAAPDVIGALRSIRPTLGTAPQEFIQLASIKAWRDETHVERNRVRYRAKRSVMLEALARVGLRVAGSEATFFLWVAVPDGETSEGFAQRLLDGGIVVAPGSYLGEHGEGYVRLALVPTLEECQQAAALLERLL